jgi:hypothetical protein
MYTKMFRAMYEGTLADDWRALVTFQQLLILADAHGVVDMTVTAIHRITGIPLEILRAGVGLLEGPDQQSRSPAEDGRRIVLLDPLRDWGWRLVNFAYYRGLMSANDKREADRLRVAAKREATRQDATDCDKSQESVGVADVAHTEAEAIQQEQKQEQQRATADVRPAAKPGRDGRRGTRLPDEWQPSEAVREWAKEAFPAVDLERVLAEFVDYWRGVPGQKGSKLDWDATFRNRVRQVAERAPRSSHGPYRESAADRAARLAREGDARDRRDGIER